MSDNNVDISFSINPLDINLAKMQFNILKKCENEISTVGDFTPLIEEYISKDPTLDISIIQIHLKNIDENIKSIEVVFFNKNQTKNFNFILCKGTSNEILAYLKKSNFVLDIKKILFSVDY